MAAHTLPQLPTHNFPQPPNPPDSPREQFDGKLVEDLISKVNRAYERINPPKPELGRCEYEEPESYFGACDGGTNCCTDRGIVCHIATEQYLCFGHFREVDRVF